MGNDVTCLKQRLWFLIALVALVAGCASSPPPRVNYPAQQPPPEVMAPAQPAPPPPATAIRFREMPFADAFKSLLVKPLPLMVSIPANYQFELIKGNQWVWTHPSALPALRKDGTKPNDHGLFTAQITTNVQYDRASDSFTCGPGCDQRALLTKLERDGLPIAAVERHTVSGVPLLLLDIDASKVTGGQRQRVYLVYASTTVDQRTVLISFRPALAQESNGFAIWQRFKNYLLGRV